VINKLWDKFEDWYHGVNPELKNRTPEQQLEIDNALKKAAEQHKLECQQENRELIESVKPALIVSGYAVLGVILAVVI